MTTKQEKDLSQASYDFGSYLGNKAETLKKRAVYWAVKANGNTIVIDGTCAFTSYGHAKSRLLSYLIKEVRFLAQAKKIKKDDTGYESQLHMQELCKLEDSEFTRAVIELRDVMLERNDLSIEEIEY